MIRSDPAKHMLRRSGLLAGRPLLLHSDQSRAQNRQQEKNHNPVNSLVKFSKHIKVLLKKD